MTTNITIRISDSRTRTPRTPRRHVSIPHTDLWTQDWWDAQSDPSASVRHLVSEDVRLHGTSDVLARTSAALVAAVLGTPFSAPVPAPAPAAPVAVPAAATPAAAPPAVPALVPVAVPAAAPGASSTPPMEDLSKLRKEMGLMKDLLTTLIPVLSELEDARIF